MAARFLLPGVKRKKKGAARNPSAMSYEVAERKVMRKIAKGRKMGGSR